MRAYRTGKWQRTAIAVLVMLCLTASQIAGPGARASADGVTPTVPVSTVEPTLIVASPEPTSAALPTVAPERSTPIVTAAPIPTEASGPRVTSGVPTTEPRSVRIVTATPQIVTAPGGPPVIAPLPSPDELRLNARLRWGTRVPGTVRRWAFLIVPVAHKYQLDPNLIAAVMTLESGGDPLAWSNADARGLMQILHGPWDPRNNIETGARMLRTLFDQFHDLNLVLAAYNAGPGAVESFHGVPPYRETRDYVIIVSYLYELYSHHHISGRERDRYRATLRDVRKFANLRKKVSRLAKIAGVSLDRGLQCRRLPNGCDSPVNTSQLVSTLDPFWPVAGTPDPLQRVDPFVAQ